MNWTIITIIVIACIIFGQTLGGFAFDDYNSEERWFKTVFRYFMAYIGMPIICVAIIILSPVIYTIHLLSVTVGSLFRKK